MVHYAPPRPRSWTIIFPSIILIRRFFALMVKLSRYFLAFGEDRVEAMLLDNFNIIVQCWNKLSKHVNALL